MQTDMARMIASRETFTRSGLDGGVALSGQGLPAPCGERSGSGSSLLLVGVQQVESLAGFLPRGPRRHGGDRAMRAGNGQSVEVHGEAPDDGGEVIGPAMRRLRRRRPVGSEDRRLLGMNADDGRRTPAAFASLYFQV